MQKIVRSFCPWWHLNHRIYKQERCTNGKTFHLFQMRLPFLQFCLLYRVMMLNTLSLLLKLFEINQHPNSAPIRNQNITTSFVFISNVFWYMSKRDIQHVNSLDMPVLLPAVFNLFYQICYRNIFWFLKLDIDASLLLKFSFSLRFNFS